MSDDRTEGSLKKMKGDVKEGAGNLTGDSKLKSEGKADKAEGKIQNAIGGDQGRHDRQKGTLSSNFP